MGRFRQQGHFRDREFLTQGYLLRFRRKDGPRDQICLDFPCVDPLTVYQYLNLGPGRVTELSIYLLFEQDQLAAEARVLDAKPALELIGLDAAHESQAAVLCLGPGVGRCTYRARGWVSTAACIAGFVALLAAFAGATVVFPTEVGLGNA